MSRGYDRLLLRVRILISHSNFELINRKYCVYVLNLPIINIDTFEVILIIFLI